MLDKSRPEESKATNDVVDIELKSLKKQRFRINGDDDKILELNTSDMGIITRLSEFYPKLQALADKAASIGMDESVDSKDSPEKFAEELAKFGAQLKEIDGEMRQYLDELFEANVSETCAPFGNMFDIVGGQFRYDNIIDKLSDLYEHNIERETKALKNRLAQKVEKYFPQDHNKSTTSNRKRRNK